jgi:hypothetical protein
LIFAVQIVPIQLFFLDMSWIVMRFLSLWLFHNQHLTISFSLIYLEEIPSGVNIWFLIHLFFSFVRKLPHLKIYHIQFWHAERHGYYNNQRERMGLCNLFALDTLTIRKSS